LEKSHLGDFGGQRPADVFLPSLFGGKPAALDIAVTCPLQSLYKDVSCPADHYAINKKHKKYDKGFEGTDIEFIPVVVDAFGHWGTEATDAIKTILTRGADRLSLSRSTYITQGWQRLGVSLQRANSKMVLDRLLVDWQ